MSQNSKINRARREEREKKQGNKIFTWIVVGLLVLAVLFVIYTVAMMG